MSVRLLSYLDPSAEAVYLAEQVVFEAGRRAGTARLTRIVSEAQAR